MIARIAALALVALAAGSGSALAAGPADDGPALDTIAATYRDSFPQMTQAAANLAAAQSDDRRALTAALMEEDGLYYGGSWYDPPSNVLHVALTTAAEAGRATDLARAGGLDVDARVVAHSFSELQAQADDIRHGSGPLSLAAAGQVGIDVKANKVVVAVPPGQKPGLQAAGAAAGVTVIADPQLKVEADSCTARDACDGSIAAGAMIWRGAAGSYVCSAGFTAEDPFTLGRFVYTAGHCAGGIGTAWGTGAESIGPELGSQDLNDIDASVIQVTNPLYTLQAGGRLWNTDDVDAVAPTLASIAIGDVVCKASNFQDPSGPRYCGVIGSNSDPAVRGMARVDSEDACGGDSGGTWYGLDAGTRTGYGVHSRSNPGCRGDAGGTRSWFSPLPTIKAGFAPGYDVETR
jgi:streptogrisin C